MTGLLSITQDFLIVTKLYMSIDEMHALILKSYHMSTREMPFKFQREHLCTVYVKKALRNEKEYLHLPVDEIYHKTTGEQNYNSPLGLEKVISFKG